MEDQSGIVGLGADLATLGGGCFWCLEGVFERLRGVRGVAPGYSGGHVPHPSYRQVCGGSTGHAEVVQLDFDGDTISFRQILEVFFAIHDPTTLNRQGADVGPQYRSVIFFHSPEQRAEAESQIRELESSGLWADPIVTEVVPFEAFFPAEPYHRGYYRRNQDQPYCRIVIDPKLARLNKEFAALMTKPESRG